MTVTQHVLQTFTELPKGCFVHAARDNAHWPFIKAGEFVVVDRNESDFASGQLYLFEYRPAEPWQDPRFVIWQVEDAEEGRYPEPCVWMHPLNRAKSSEELSERFEAGRGLYVSDGPLMKRFLPKYITGRVVGIYDAGCQEVHHDRI